MGGVLGVKRRWGWPWGQRGDWKVLGDIECLGAKGEWRGVLGAKGDMEVLGDMQHLGAKGGLGVSWG